MTGADRLLHVGTVGKPHGVRGEVKVIPEVDEPERLERLEVWFVGRSEEMAEPLRIERMRYQHSSKGLTLLVKFEGFESPEAVGAHRGDLVLVREEDWGFDEDQGLEEDLIGFDVVTPEGEQLGELTQVLDMPAQSLYEITGSDGRTALVPAVDEFVREVDIENRRIVVAPIEGLFE